MSCAFYWDILFLSSFDATNHGRLRVLDEILNLYQTNHCNTQDQDLECFFNSSEPISCSEVIELINSTYRCFKFSFDLAGAGAAAGGIFTASVVFNLILVRLFVCVRYCTTSCGLTASISRGVTAFIQLIIAIAIFVLFFIYIRLVHNIHDDSDKIIQTIAIFFCSVFCCAYPWYLIGPPRDSDQQYEEIERNEKRIWRCCSSPACNNCSFCLDITCQYNICWWS